MHENRASPVSGPASVDAVTRLLKDGFATLQLDRTTSSALGDAFQSARTFFALSKEERESSNLPHDCGYRPTGVEYSASPDRPDPIESFTASERTRRAAAELRSASARDLHENLLYVMEALEPFAESIITLLAEKSNADAPPSSFYGMLRMWSCVQMNYARPSDSVVDFINEEHEDGHLITLTRATASGMEVLTRSAGFVPVTLKKDELLVMPGEILQLLSGGLIEPLYHRVRRHPTCAERLALLYFVDIDPQLCTAWSQNDTNSHVDIGARVRTNSRRFGLAGFDSEDG